MYKCICQVKTIFFLIFCEGKCRAVALTWCQKARSDPLRFSLCLCIRFCLCISWVPPFSLANRFSRSCALELVRPLVRGETLKKSKDKDGDNNNYDILMDFGLHILVFIIGVAA